MKSETTTKRIQLGYKDWKNRQVEEKTETNEIDYEITDEGAMGMVMSALVDASMPLRKPRKDERRRARFNKERDRLFAIRSMGESRLFEIVGDVISTNTKELKEKIRVRNKKNIRELYTDFFEYSLSKKQRLVLRNREYRSKYC